MGTAWALQCLLRVASPGATDHQASPSPLSIPHVVSQGVITHVERHRLEQEFDQRLVAEVERQLRLSEEERKVVQMRQHITDNILTLRCPRGDCRQAFLDFTNCCAVHCSRCGCGYCALCQRDCGDDAHRHAKQCTGIGSVYMPLPQIEERWRERRSRLVTEYLRGVGDAQLRARVMAECARDFADLGLEINA